MFAPPGGGGLPYERGGDARRKLWIKGDYSGRSPIFVFLSLKAIFLNFDYMNRVDKTNWKYIIFFNISSNATLRETFTAKYNGVLPRTP